MKDHAGTISGLASWQARVSERIARLVAETGIGALALAIRRDGELIYGEGFDDDVSIDTLFPSCSAAKPITALLALRCVDDGLLALDRPITDYLPRLTSPPGGDVRRVTLRHLLSHHSGLSSDPDFAAIFFDDPTVALEWHVYDEIPRLAAIEPGAAPIYSNPGFNLAGYLAAEARRTDFATVVRDVVLEPLGMSRTTYDPESILAAEPLTTLPPDVERAAPIPYPAGGALTTARDMTRLGSSLAGAGPTIVGARSRALMQAVHVDARTRAPRWYGLGLSIGRDNEQYGGWQPLMHGGGGFGCGASLVVLPEQNIAAAVLFNHAAGYAVNLMDLLVDLIGRGDRAVEREPDVFFPGRYVGCIPSDGFPASLEVLEDGDQRFLSIDGAQALLTEISGSVFTTEEGTTIGFDGAGRFSMLDPYGIGLVSALPFERVS